MYDVNHKEPYINLWFGNFYRPAFDNTEFIDEAMKKLKKLGFNNIQLDSKAWEDFKERYHGDPASDYVKMQEYMMEKAKENDISYNSLALYLNVDGAKLSGVCFSDLWVPLWVLLYCKGSTSCAPRTKK